MAIASYEDMFYKIRRERRYFDLFDQTLRTKNKVFVTVQLPVDIYKPLIIQLAVLRGRIEALSQCLQACKVLYTDNSVLSKFQNQHTKPRDLKLIRKARLVKQS
jgi:hypothetical protein